MKLIIIIELLFLYFNGSSLRNSNFYSTERYGSAEHNLGNTTLQTLDVPDPKCYILLRMLSISKNLLVLLCNIS
jgi:hypothetical protein